MNKISKHFSNFPIEYCNCFNFPSFFLYYKLMFYPHFKYFKKSIVLNVIFKLDTLNNFLTTYLIFRVIFFKLISLDP